MNSLEQAPDFDTITYGMENEFDIDAAFRDAMHGVASDTELALDEKVQRMEFIVSEGTSELYREFVDLRSMAAQMEMYCNHDHALNQLMQGSDMLSGFMDSFKDDGHNHNSNSFDKHDHKNDDLETDPVTGKKRKKKQRK
ncbi:MAG TPA: hypothetical protein VLF79_02615 [Candidatus Saccharimonadales bacterium]|nr:hypothetical protein [Candidatus Saccharimonadales bacterium]